MHLNNKMELKVLTAQNEQKGNITLPIQFEEEVRPDLIKRAVLAIQANSRQPYGAARQAGLRHSADLSRRRRKYRGSYGIGISRVPRKITSRRGTRMNWIGAIAPGTVGGRRAHPPKAEKIWAQKINKKEKRKAIRSAIAATLLKELVKKRGHHPPNTYPFVLDDSLEQLNKTKEVVKGLTTLGLLNELQRAAQKKIRAGKGKARGRPYKKRKGPLLVVSGNCPLLKTAKNIPGIDIVTVSRINAKQLAPGGSPARLTLFTKKAIETLDKKQLFITK